VTAWYRRVYRRHRARAPAGGRLVEADHPLVELGQISGATLADRWRAGVCFSGGVVVAQLRSTAIDLPRATGVDREAATRAVRTAAEPEPAGQSRASTGPCGVASFHRPRPG
jgi:hypothetical protein